MDNEAGDLISGLSEEEKELYFGLLSDTPEAQIDVTDTMVSHMYHTKPVSIEQFIEDPYYLGEVSIWKELRKDLIDLFSYPYVECVITGSIGVGKCVDGRTEITRSDTGERVTIAEAVNHDRKTQSFDGKNVSWKSCEFVQSGVKLVGDLVLRSGKRAGLTPDHPVLTPFGYKKIGELKYGDLVATARSLPGFKRELDVSDSEIKWVGYMLADGACTQSLRFTKESPSIIEDFSNVVSELGGKLTPRKSKSKATEVGVVGLTEIRNKYGLRDRSRDKRIPSKLYGLNNRQLALLLNRIWSCDGWVCRRGERNWELGITLSNERFIHDIQQLLLRFGINSRYRERDVSYIHNGEKRYSKAWQLQVLGSKNIRLFFEKIGALVGKERVIEDAINEIKDVKSNTNVDITPVDNDVLNRIKLETGRTIPKQYAICSRVGAKMGHDKFKKFVNNYDVPGWCSWWGDVFWDPVESYDIRREPEAVYDVEVPETKNFSVHGIIVHNTHLASIAICRILYELSCLISPQETFGLSSGSELAIPLVSKNLHLARGVMKSAVDAKLKESVYFMEKFSPRIKTDETIFPNNIRMMIASYGSDHILGTSTIAAFMDETNFPPKRKDQQITTAMGQRKTKAHFDPTEKVYRTLSRRIESRFLKARGDFPCMMILTSSASILDSFTERKIKDSRNKPSVFVRDHVPWTAKPKDRFSKEVFWVLCSSSSMRSKILTEDEHEKINDEYLEENESYLIDIPIDYKEDFEMDLEGSLKDIAGISVQAISAFVQRVECVDLCADESIPHSFSSGEWTAGGPGGFRWDKLCRKFERRMPGGFTEEAFAPIVNPNSARWCHIDTSTSGDATGFCVGHIDRWVEVVRRGEDGNRYTDLEPFYYIDVILRINPPQGEQIYLPDVRRLVYDLMKHGYQFMGLSTDTYMYVEIHQQIKRRGITPHIISPDTSTEPYDDLKSAVYENRIRYHKYEPFIEEFKDLEYDRIKGKIDHQQHGSKDCSDSLSCVVHALKIKSSRLPMDLESDTPNIGRKDSWVSPLIPASQIDKSEIKNYDDDDFLPITFGD